MSNTTPKGQQIPQTVESLQKVMARDAVYLQIVEGNLTAQRVKNNQLIQEKRSLKKRLGLIESEIETMKKRAAQQHNLYWRDGHWLAGDRV